MPFFSNKKKNKTISNTSSSKEEPQSTPTASEECPTDHLAALSSESEPPPNKSPTRTSPPSTNHRHHQHNNNIPPSSHKSNRYMDELDVDYDVNPSLLYKHIENKDWDAAAARAVSHPQEAYTWVSRYEIGSQTKLRWKLLPIHATCIFRSPLSLVETLLAAFPDGCQMKDDQGMLPIHLACRNGASKGVIMLLLDHFPPSVFLKDRKGRSPLAFMEASTSQNQEAVVLAMKQFITENKAAINITHQNHATSDILQAPSESVNEVDYENRTVLFRLVLKKDWENAVIRAKSVPEEACTWIVTKGYKGNLRFLPLHKACVLNPPDSVIDTLVAAYPEGAKSKDQDGWLPIHCGCFYGASRGVIDTLLIAYPKGAQSKDDEGRLPIHYACLKGASTGVIESLIGTYPKGAQSKDDEGRLPIHHACSKGAPEGVIMALLNSSPKGAQSKDDQGRLPIHHACRKGSSEKIVKALLKTYPKGPQVKDDQDKLPIHYICQNGGSEEVVNILLSAYPNAINVKNGFGYTPLAEAKQVDTPQMERIVTLLQKFQKKNPQLSPSSTSGGNHPQAMQAVEESVQRAVSAEKKAAEAMRQVAVYQTKMEEMEFLMKKMQAQIHQMSKMGGEVKNSLAEGVTAREVLEKFGQKLNGIRK